MKNLFVCLTLLWFFLSSHPITGQGTPNRAFAYNRVKTSTGIPTAWNQMPIKYFIGKNGSKNVTDGSDIGAIKQAFATWANVDCAKLSFLFGGLLENPKAEFDPKGTNQNHIFWVEPPHPWPFPSGAVAVTTIKARPNTGEIYDADIRFNGHEYKWSTKQTPFDDEQDILNTATHEIGHLLGLDHTEVSNTTATMHEQTKSGETLKRSLELDDKMGLCAIYPKNPEDRISFTVVKSDDGLIPCASNTLPQHPSRSQIPQGCHLSKTPSSFIFPLILLILFPLCLHLRHHVK